MSQPLPIEALLAQARAVIGRVHQSGSQALNITRRREAHALVVPPRIASDVLAHRVAAVIKRSRFDVTGRTFILTDGTSAYGEVQLNEPDALTKGEVATLAHKHGMPPEDLDRYWPGSQRLHLYKVAHAVPYAKPRVLVNCSPAPVSKRLFHGQTQHFGVTGIHVHSLDRASGGTLYDGLHSHAFRIGSEIVFTTEDGAHQHAKAAELRTGKDGAHVHTLRLPDGRQFRTTKAGAHAHDLTVGTTGVDGAHAHEVEIDGVVYPTLTPQAYLDALPDPPPQLEPAPPASWLAKHISGTVAAQADAGPVPGAPGAPERGAKSFSGFCFSADTSVFTRQGRKLIGDVTGDDELMTLRRDGQIIEYQRPTCVQAFDYDGELVEFAGKLYNQAVTPNHRCLVRRQGQAEFEVVSAEDLMRSNVRNTEFFAGGANWRCTDLATFDVGVADRIRRLRAVETDIAQLRATDLGAIEISRQLELSKSLVESRIYYGHGPRYEQENLQHAFAIDDWLVFLGWWLAEGYVARNHNTWNVQICQTPCNQQHVAWREEIKAVIRRMGFSPSANDAAIQFTSRPLGEYLRRFGHAHQKYIPDELKQLPPHRLRLMFDAMMKGDGSRGCTYYTVSPRLRDDMMEIGLKLGYAVGFHTRPARGDRRRPTHAVGFSKTSTTPSIRTMPRMLPYRGKVYGVSVPNGILAVERRGRVMFSGNSNFDACVREMTDSGGYTEESARRICGKLQAETEIVAHKKRTGPPREILLTVRTRQVLGPNLVRLGLAAPVTSTPDLWADVYPLGENLAISVGQTILPASADVEVGTILRARVDGFLLTTDLPRTLRAFGVQILDVAPARARATPVDAIIRLLRDGEVRGEPHFFDAHLGRPVRLLAKQAPTPDGAADQEERFVLGIVLEPDAPDAQGHIYNAVEVRAAAHYFMEFHRALGLMHQVILDSEAAILESYVAPGDFAIGDQFVPRGTWVLGARIYDDNLWNMIKTGQIAAWSIGGWGVVQEARRAA